jgi:hypothetical protein
VGEDIGEETLVGTSCIVSMSADGSRLAVGAPYTDVGDTGDYTGHVSIYDLSKTPFTPVGDAIVGESGGDFSGASVVMSDDGSRVVIGAPQNDGINGVKSGHVRVYDLGINLDGTTSTWNKVGADLDGEAPGDNFGTSVAMSADGGRVVIGTYRDAGSKYRTGHARIYDLSDLPFTQVGEDIDSDGPLAHYFTISVVMSADGSRVAMGAEHNGDNGSYSGQVRIYDEIATTWTQFGQDINGEAVSDFSGKSIAMSADGSKLAIGAMGFDSIENDWAGHVRVYKVCGLQYPRVLLLFVCIVYLRDSMNPSQQVSFSNFYD